MMLCYDAIILLRSPGNVESRGADQALLGKDEQTSRQSTPKPCADRVLLSGSRTTLRHSQTVVIDDHRLSHSTIGAHASRTP
jgi:hypothetical protein